MRLQPKILISIIPIVGIALALTGWLVIKNATQASHDAVFRYSEGILKAYISQDLEQRAVLLKKNQLDEVPSFVERYQKEALDAASKLNLIWPGHLFVSDKNNNIILCTSGEMPQQTPVIWEDIRKKAQRLQTSIKGHLPIEGNESFVAHYFEPWNWLVVVTIKGDFLHHKDFTIWTTVTIIGLLTSIALIISLGILLHRLVLTPVRQLREATNHIATHETPVSIPIRDKDEFGELSRDIEQMSTTIHQSKKDLQEAFNDLKSLDEMKTTLIANVSHELRTPLTAILGFAQIGLKKSGKCQYDKRLSPEENAQKISTAHCKTLQIIHEQGKSMAEMVDNIIMLMSLISEEKVVQLQPQDITPLIRRVSHEYCDDISAKGLTFNLELPPKAVPVRVDVKLIESVLGHYIANAIAFTEKGSIDVIVSSSSDEAIVKVVDTGVGITEEAVPHVFDQFYQAGDIMTEKPKGLGIGLSICRQIIELHNGRVWVESISGQGSSFFFSLPLPKSN